MLDRLFTWTNYVPAEKIDQDLTSIRNSAVVVKHKQIDSRYIFRADRTLHEKYYGLNHNTFVDKLIDMLVSYTLRNLLLSLEKEIFHDQA